MKRHMIIIGLLLLTGAEKPPAINSPPPAPTVIDRAPQPSVWQQIQPSLNRSTGRIVDEPTYQLYRIQRAREEQLHRVQEQTESERFREERERQLRIDQRSAQRQNESLRNQPEAVQPLNPNLGQSSTTIGPSPVAAQATADELALSRVRNARDKQLTAANQQRLNDLRQRPSERGQIETEYQRQVEEIERQFQNQRNVILDGGPAPTTQP